MPSATTVSPSKFTSVVNCPVLIEYLQTVPQQAFEADECEPPWAVVP
jgi:hypothetical protein